MAGQRGNKADGLYEGNGIDGVGNNLIRSSSLEQLRCRGITGRVYTDDSEAQTAPSGDLSGGDPGDLSASDNDIDLVRPRFDISWLVRPQHDTQ